MARLLGSVPKTLSSVVHESLWHHEQIWKGVGRRRGEVQLGDRGLLGGAQLAARVLTDFEHTGMNVNTHTHTREGMHACQKVNTQHLIIEVSSVLRTEHVLLHQMEKKFNMHCWDWKSKNSCRSRSQPYPSTAPITEPATSPLRPRFSLKRPTVTAAHIQSFIISMCRNLYWTC